MIKVKICGITNARDAKCAVEAGADFLGFVFYKKSPRYVMPEIVGQLSVGLPKKILKVGVFVDEDPRVVKQIARQCGLDYLQFHGQETSAYLKHFKVYKIIKAVRMKDKKSLGSFKVDSAQLFLCDTFSPTKFGGTGKTFDWRILQGLKVPFIVSGGLTPENVGELLTCVQPFAVDVSSGVEKEPGKKDPRMVKKFIKKVQQAARHRP